MLLSILVGLALAHAMFGCFYVAVVASKREAKPEIVATHIAGPVPPSIFCDEVGCYEMFGHTEPHTPRVRNLSDSYADYVEGYPDGGKHRGAPEARVARFSGYEPKHAKA